MLILSPARTVIEMCGGASAVAKMTKRNLYRVHRWTWPREKGGLDGIIPLDSMQMILAQATARNIEGLTADHFLQGAGVLSRADLATLAMLMDGYQHGAIASRLGVSTDDVVKTESRLRKSPLIGDLVWRRVDNRRAPTYRSRARR